MADTTERIILDVDERGVATALSSANKHVAAMERTVYSTGRSVEQNLLVKIANLKQTMQGDPLQLQRLDQLQERVLGRMKNNVQGFGDKIQQFIASPLQSVSEAAGGALKALGPVGTTVSAIIGVATIGATKFKSMAEGLGDWAERTLQVSVRTGLTTKEVTQFSNAAQLSGMAIDDFESSMRGLARVLDATSTEGKDGRRALAEMGVTVYDVNGKLRPMGELWLDIADAVSRVEDPSKRATVAMDLFKRTGINLLPVLGDLRNAVDEMKKLEFGTDEAKLRELDRVGDTLKTIEKIWGKLIKNAKVELVLNLKGIVEWLGKESTQPWRS